MDITIIINRCAAIYFDGTLVLDPVLIKQRESGEAAYRDTRNEYELIDIRIKDFMDSNQGATRQTINTL